MNLLRLAACLIAAAVLTSGCSSPPEPDAEVTLDEMAIAIAEDQPMGTSVWRVRNTGEAHHNLTICPGTKGECVDEAVVQRVLVKPEGARDPDALPDETGALVLGNGWETLVEVNLEPGRYRLYCAVPNHVAKGMESIIMVR